MKLPADRSALSRGGETSDHFDVLLARQVDAAARALTAWGISPGDTVAARIGDRSRLLALVFAARQAGATVTLIDPARGPVGTTRLVTSTQAALLVVEDDTHVGALRTALPAVGVATIDRLIGGMPPSAG